jgi:hypothetical protein
MHQGRGPLTRHSGRVWAQAAAIVCVAMLGLVAVAVAAPKGDQGPPAQAHGNGPPAAAPGQAKTAPAAGGTTRPAAAKPAAGHSSGGGHAKARAIGHSGPSAGTTSGGQGTAGGNAYAVGHTGSGTSERHASPKRRSGKVTLCHATGSGKHPSVEITVSPNAVSGQARRRKCASGASQGDANEDGSGTLLPRGGPVGHRTPADDTPSGEGDTVDVSDEGGSEPGADGGVLGADQGGGDDSGATAEATSASLPFTGLGLGLLVATGAMLALAGVYLRRRTT